MKFTNMRLVGFKSFVEATDFEIHEGLTGVVGPNGCGKSNVLEALRWVMGATSAKALRGGGMGDVIFAGTSMRPARNWAEVILTLDNSDRSAPAEYNDENTIEVSRRILHKDEGTQSIYRINNREARAKDVQLLFADASTGANSPSLVRQGQVADLINAKPQNRRRLLEDAAGITGLHSRRHEAELRLRAAETNLDRLDDVTGELESQKTALARQARQATRYRNISGDIRRAEAMAAFLRWRDANETCQEAQSALDEIADLIEDTARAAAAASTAQTAAHDALAPLREEEARQAAGLHRLTVERDNLEAEAERARRDLARLTGEQERLQSDKARETGLLTDAQEAVHACAREEEGLRARERSERERLTEADARQRQARQSLEHLEEALQARSSEAAEAEARRRSATTAIEGGAQRLSRLSQKRAALEEEHAQVRLTTEQSDELAAAKRAYMDAQTDGAKAETALHRAEEERAAASDREHALRPGRQKAEHALAEITAERDALKKVLAANPAGDWPALIEMVDVHPGYENALAAALGDDLDAALAPEAPVFWRHRADAPHEPDEIHLPDGAAPLSRFVTAPPQLAKRLRAVGVVASEQGDRLQTRLAPGVRLVSREGSLWRWDGFIARAEAKTAGAIRLEQRNRLQALGEDFALAQARAIDAKDQHEKALEAARDAQRRESRAKDLFRGTRGALENARQALATLERNHANALTRAATLDEALAGLKDDQQEAERALCQLQDEQAALPDPAVLAAALAAAREAATSARARASEARAAHGDLAREAQMRAARLEELGRERGVWSTRAETARTRLSELETRIQETQTDQAAAANAPAIIDARRSALLDKIEAGESERRAAADALEEATTQAAHTDKIAKQADGAAAEARETRARLEAQKESAEARLSDAVRLAHETCEAAPEDLLEVADHKEGKDLPAREDVDRKLERYKRERETLGGVNLRADEELQEITARLEEITVERDDCEAAIRKLRAAIGGINREARQRLNAAFETVNTNFTSLFTRLFNGGQAELRLIESEDVLEAGLEIYASPPGKKLASMSLMSGGEQAMTATALIFAVFMANPAPVCVLDEVDAPLDDANTERFCRLLREMAKETQTRFVVITHHALTMSRMDRLFGVTMIERGVSQLVSVDLQAAAKFAAE